MEIHSRGTAALGLIIATAIWATGCASAKVGTKGTATAQPTGGEFTIMPWEIEARAVQLEDQRVGIASLKDCGFTTAAFVREQDVPVCKKLGMKALVRLESTPTEKTNAPWTKLTDAQIEDRVRRIIGKTADDETVVGYFLRDEPGAGEFAALGKAVAWVKKLAPGKLAYINLLPDYATLGAPDLSQLGTTSYHEYLERYVAEVRPQFLSYDNYRILFSGDMKDPKVAASYFSNLVEVRRVAKEHGLPFWNIVTGNEIRKTTPVPSPANMLMQAYTTLAAGGKGLTWFTYYGWKYRYGAVTQEGSRTVTWSYMRMVNEQVRVVGRITKDLDSVGVYFVGNVPGVTGMALPGKWMTEAKADAPLMVGELEAKGGERYAVVVNLSLEKSVRVTVKGTGGEIRQISPVDGTEMGLDDGEAVWLTAGQGVLLRAR